MHACIDRRAYRTPQGQKKRRKVPRKAEKGKKGKTGKAKERNPIPIRWIKQQTAHVSLLPTYLPRYAALSENTQREGRGVECRDAEPRRRRKHPVLSCIMYVQDGRRG